MIAPAIRVDAGGAPHLATADQHDLVAQPARLAVFDEGRDGVVERNAAVAHPLLGPRIVDVGVVVPHEGGGDRHKPRPRLAQAPRQQQQLAQSLGVFHIVRVVVPPAGDAVGGEEGGGVVAGHHGGIFARQVERRRRPTHNRAEGLLAQFVEPFELPRRVELEPHAVEFSQQRPAVSQPVDRQAQLHVALQVSPGPGNKRRVRRPHPTGRLEVAKVLDDGPGIGIDRPGKQRRVVGNAGQRVVRSHHARVERTDICPAAVAPHNRLDVVVAVAGGEGTDNRELVGERRQLGQRPAKGDPGNLRLHFPRGALDADRGGHLGIERLDLAGAAMLEEENDRLAGGHPARRGGVGRQQLGQGQPTERQAPHAQEVPPPVPCRSAVNPQHASTSCSHLTRPAHITSR